MQTFWHKYIVDAAEPRGWGNQIRAEPGLLVTYLHKRRYGDSNGLQFVPHAGASIGTIPTNGATCVFAAVPSARFAREVRGHPLAAYRRWIREVSPAVDARLEEARQLDD